MYSNKQTPGSDIYKYSCVLAGSISALVSLIKAGRRRTLNLDSLKCLL